MRTETRMVKYRSNGPAIAKAREGLLAGLQKLREMRLNRLSDIREHIDKVEAAAKSIDLSVLAEQTEAVSLGKFPRLQFDKLFRLVP